MYEEVGISSNNVPITLSIWYTECVNTIRC